MIDLRLNIRDDRQFKSLTGLSEEKFEKLCPIFCEVYEEALEEAHVQDIFQDRRKNERGGGRKGKLPTIEDKLFFVLYYFKVYPTFDVLASTFGMSRSKACENVHKFTPVLYEALYRAGFMPYRHFESVEEFKKAFEGIDRIIIDATERKHVRPQDSEKQTEMYSGKKKGHTIKNTIISTTEKVIMFVGQTLTGHNHDYKMLKEEFPPDKPWFRDINVLLDLAYQGIQNDYEGKAIEIPVKKPRKSKGNPEPKLSQEAKEKNRALSKIRIFIENAIGGMKRYNILNHPVRNKKNTFIDDAIAICAGLWNMILPALN